MVLFLLMSFSTLLFRDILGTITSQRCQEDEESSNVTTGSPYAPSGLICYREWKKDNKLFNCTWRRGKDLSEYRLCYCCDTCKTCRSFEVGNKTSYIVERDNLYMNKNLTFWVETANGNSKMKSEKLYVVPEQAEIKYKPLSIKKVNLARSAGLLTLSWAKSEKKRIFNEIRYQSKDAREWKQVNCSSSELKAYENCTILLDEPSTYKLQIRMIHQNIWSEWSNVAYIPAAITESLGLRWRLDNKQHCPGRRRIKLEWQAPRGVKAVGYNLTFEWANNMTGYSIKWQNTSYQTTISLAAYKVSIFAFNKVSTSPAETILIPAARPEDIPDLNLTAVDNHTLKGSWIPHKVNFYCAFLELVSTGIMQHRICQSVKHQEFRKKTGHHQPTEVVFSDLEPQRRYRLTVHAKDSKKSDCHSKAGHTIGSATACTQEYPPTHGPMMVNVTNIMKSSVFLQWKGISLGECQGTLLKYLIIYTNGWNHTYTASVNAWKLNYTLVNLNASTLYTVQICGVTTAGQGAKTIRTFQTRDYDHSEFMAITVATSFFVMLAVFAVVSLCYFSYKRTERMVCPTVPDPVNSLAVKSIHISNHISQWEACSAEEDVTDVLVAVISLQNDTILSGEPATGDTVPMTEDAGSAGDGDSLGFGSDSAFEYRRQMGSPLDLEEDCSSEADVGVQSPVPETGRVCPLARLHSGSRLNLSGNMISLLSIYNQTPAEEEPARSSVDT
ncbi:interleukin-12 receptor subunit beta-1-like [Hypanus sabinus]|uniref:interleukin-12 receptor subunit beta-1-like n=1 Tax=Hypanus sabinus TaxID=79690 RepID=UPI0028C3AD8E|nr:interleukin-12 receptor subunit beta-1-like [Hypanus sabinus]